MTRSVRPHRRIAALALAALWATVPFAALLHDDDHGHRYCVEHQAFEEGAAPESVGTSRAAQGAEDGINAAPQPSDLLHQKCPVADAPSRDALAAAATPASTLVDFVEPTTPVAFDGSRPQIAALFLAPKASPPVRLS